MVYQHNPDMAPDSDFVSGELKYLVAGNEARMLDPRRTPVRLVEFRRAAGLFVMEVLAFEDRGARWEIPFESVSSFQFARGCDVASADEVAAFSDAVARLDRALQLPADPAARSETEARIASLSTDVGAWLERESAFLASGAKPDFTSRAGAPALWADLQRYMESLELSDIEAAFATQRVSNPYSGEIVKGHAVVLAELGLVPFDGKLVRDAGTFAAPWDKSRRADHIVHRLSFVRELFDRLSLATVPLYRGMSFAGAAGERTADSFVSSTFSLEVATALFDDGDVRSNGVLLRQATPIRRLFMTYLETEQMNQQYAEAEAVLLGDSSGDLF